MNHPNPESPFYLFAAFLFGSILGSFLNVLVYRLPRGESIVTPGSRCPSCGARIRYYDNIPILSFFLLKGRCRDCSARIPLRYPLVEFVTGFMAAAIFALQGPSIQLFADTALGVLLLAAAMIDFRHMIIPNRLTYPGMLIGLFFSLQWGWFGFLRGIHGAVAGVLILCFMYFLGKLLFNREGLGMGDVKLAAAMGFFLGPFWNVVALVLAVFFGGSAGILQMALGRRRPGQEVPFGPFLALGGLCVIFFRRQLLFLVERYLNTL